MDILNKLIAQFNKQLDKILASELKPSEMIVVVKNLRKQFLGPTSQIKLDYQDKIKTLDNLVKKEMGKVISEINLKIEDVISKQEKLLKEHHLSKKLKDEALNLNNNLYAKTFNGSMHPINATIWEIAKFFQNLGYTILNGQEVETSKYNFEYLNIPKNHPARNMHDSFFINKDLLLRTHCTNMTARYLDELTTKNVPMQIISFGNVYRKDKDDATHSHQFCQVDVLNLGKHISLANLKWTLLELVKHLFGENTRIRFRPSYFPFTEPSLEVDISCNKCGGQGCSFCKHSGWIEVLGAGMIHPNVINMTGHSSKKIQGFAFGVGIERIVLLKYGIDDIRHLYTNDLRFLSQFRF